MATVDALEREQQRLLERLRRDFDRGGTEALEDDADAMSAFIRRKLFPMFRAGTLDRALLADSIEIAANLKAAPPSTLRRWRKLAGIAKPNGRPKGSYAGDQPSERQARRENAVRRAAERSGSTD